MNTPAAGASGAVERAAVLSDAALRRVLLVVATHASARPAATRPLLALRLVSRRFSWLVAALWPWRRVVVGVRTLQNHHHAAYALRHEAASLAGALASLGAGAGAGAGADATPWSMLPCVGFGVALPPTLAELDSLLAGCAPAVLAACGAGLVLHAQPDRRQGAAGVASVATVLAAAVALVRPRVALLSVVTTTATAAQCRGRELAGIDHLDLGSGTRFYEGEPTLDNYAALRRALDAAAADGGPRPQTLRLGLDSRAARDAAARALFVGAAARVEFSHGELFMAARLDDPGPLRAHNAVGALARERNTRPGTVPTRAGEALLPRLLCAAVTAYKRTTAAYLFGLCKYECGCATHAASAVDGGGDDGEDAACLLVEARRAALSEFMLYSSSTTAWRMGALETLSWALEQGACLGGWGGHRLFSALCLDRVRCREVAVAGPDAEEFVRVLVAEVARRYGSAEAARRVQAWVRPPRGLAAPLCSAAASARPELVRYLLELGADAETACGLHDAEPGAAGALSPLMHLALRCSEYESARGLAAAALLVAVGGALDRPHAAAPEDVEHHGAWPVPMTPLELSFFMAASETFAYGLVRLYERTAAAGVSSSSHAGAALGNTLLRALVLGAEQDGMWFGVVYHVRRTRLAAWLVARFPGARERVGADGETVHALACQRACFQELRLFLRPPEKPVPPAVEAAGEACGSGANQGLL